MVEFPLQQRHNPVINKTPPTIHAAILNPAKSGEANIAIKPTTTKVKDIPISQAPQALLSYSNFKGSTIG